MKKTLKQTLSIALILGLLSVFVGSPVEAARSDDTWLERDGTYIETQWSEGKDVLINGTSKYLNFNTTSGTSGYGFRDNGGSMQFKSASGLWASLGSAIIGTFSTTTSGVSGQLINYPNGATDIVTIGSAATTTAEYWFDPNISLASFAGKMGLGSTSPFAKLSIHAQYGTNDGAYPLFQIASSTATATTTLFQILADGNIYAKGNVSIGTTTSASHLTLSNTPLGTGAVATTTFQIGDNGTTTSVACFNTKNTAGSNISFYFVGTGMVVENNACR